MTLTHQDHDRGHAGLTYVYPVVSRRAGGISIGINLNPNNACNWRCVYCQVPGLVAGRAPRIDLTLLEGELAHMLALARDPRWLELNAPDPACEVRDIALAGNGEPTSAEELDQVLSIAAGQRDAAGLAATCGLTLITNGSLAHLARVRNALELLAALGGEVWCKLDAGDDAGLERINSAHTGIERASRNLEICARACPTWVQTLAFDWGGPTVVGAGLERYCDVLAAILARGAPLRGVRLYGLARESHQPEAGELRALDAAQLEAIAQRIRVRTKLEVRVSV